MVALKPALLKQLRSRDQWCWHCGADTDLVPHHRKNRQAGGSKQREQDVTNIVLVCALWNGAMESDADMAEKARHYGHKLRSWQATHNPVCDIPSGRWYRLTSDGGKVETVEDDIPF